MLQEIPAYSTNTIMNARYMGSYEQNTTSYIRIRTEIMKHKSGGYVDGPAMTLPFDVEVRAGNVKLCKI